MLIARKPEFLLMCEGSSVSFFIAVTILVPQGALACKYITAHSAALANSFANSGNGHVSNLVHELAGRAGA